MKEINHSQANIIVIIVACKNPPMDAKLSGQKIKEKQDINSFKVSTKGILSVRKEK